MKSSRKLTFREEILLEYLIQKASRTLSADWKKDLLVCPMDDGGMGSLYLLPKDKKDVNRVFGEQISDLQFIDKDGISIIASLNVDEDGDLFELDIWKTNFDKLEELPESFNVEIS